MFQITVRAGESFTVVGAEAKGVDRGLPQPDPASDWLDDVCPHQPNNALREYTWREMGESGNDPSASGRVATLVWVAHPNGHMPVDNKDAARARFLLSECYDIFVD